VASNYGKETYGKPMFFSRLFLKIPIGFSIGYSIGFSIGLLTYGNIAFP